MAKINDSLLYNKSYKLIIRGHTYATTAPGSDCFSADVKFIRNRKRIFWKCTERVPVEYGDLIFKRFVKEVANLIKPYLNLKETDPGKPNED